MSETLPVSIHLRQSSVLCWSQRFLPLCPAVRALTQNTLGEAAVSLCPACKAETAPPAQLGGTGAIHRLSMPVCALPEDSLVARGAEKKSLGENWAGPSRIAHTAPSGHFLTSACPCKHQGWLCLHTPKATCYPPLLSLQLPKNIPLSSSLGSSWAEPEAVPPCPRAWKCCSPAHTILLSICHHNPSISRLHKNTDGTAASFQQLSKLETHLHLAQMQCIPLPRGWMKTKRALENLMMVSFRDTMALSPVCCHSSPPQQPCGQSPGQHSEQGTGCVPWCCQLVPVPVPGSPGHCSPTRAQLSTATPGCCPSLLCTAWG